MKLHIKMVAIVCITIIVISIVIATTVNVNTVGDMGVGAIDGTAITAGIGGIITIATKKNSNNYYSGKNR